jgi:hypothetical protein
MKKRAENAEEFNCEYCDFKCCKPSDWTRHIMTRKHQFRTNSNKKTPKSATPTFVCKKCNKNYKSRSGLWNHENKYNKEVIQYDSVIERMFSENQELRNVIVEQSKTIEKIMMQNTDIISKALDSNKIVNSNNNNTINNNQKFNLNLFLNEQCKDALNFNEFMENIQISYQDLENNAQLGFVAGISKNILGQSEPTGYQ